MVVSRWWRSGRSTGSLHSLFREHRASTPDVVHVAPDVVHVARLSTTDSHAGLIGGSSTRVDGSPTKVTSKKFIDSAHVYKNRLQSYAVKRNLQIPVYSCEREGPPHAPHFRCKVTFEGKTTEVSECYSTIKEAEHAAAKNAWESWSLDEVQQDDTILYKNLLQVYLQKKGCPVPKYETTMSGPSHKPNFVSKVIIKGHVFEGQATSSKKRAESHVAKVAYLGLQDPSTSNMTEELNEAGNSNLCIGQKIETQPEEVNKAGNSELCIREQIETQPECLANTDEAPPLSSGTENSAKRLRLSSQDLLDSNYSALSSIESNNVHLQIGSTHSKTSTNETIVVRPVIPNITSPAGTCTFPFSDKKWVTENMNSKK